MENSTKPTNAAISNPRRAPKSRNGCLRCKAKRLKCDEKKPECLQCGKKNLPCPGYKTKPLVWSTKHEKLLVPDAQLPTFVVESSKRLQEIVSSPKESEKERESSQTTSPEKQSDIPFLPIPSEDAPSPSPKPISSAPPMTSGSATNALSSHPPIPTTDSLAAIRHQLQRSSVPQFLLHLPTMLVEYYFSYVCQIFSSFDGTLNPFRSTIGRLWDGSAPIYYAIQSMAAAYLANHFPRMVGVGVMMQRETFGALCSLGQGGGTGGGGEGLDKMLLTVLLVGQTTAWHEPRDLGLVHLKTAKRLNRRRLEQQSLELGTRERRQNEFFEQCILYWDMLAGFVSDDVDEFGFESSSPTSTSSATSPPTTLGETHRIFPHPWTGVAPKIQRLFAQTGRLIRSYRKSLSFDATSLDFLDLDLNLDFNLPSQASIQALQTAQTLEEELLGFEAPALTSLVDAGDQNTPVHQYLLVAEAYRCAALLQLYRVFPHLLSRRVPVLELGFSSFEPSYDGGGDSTGTGIGNLPIPFSQHPNDFLLNLALHTVSLLETLPPTSGTRCIQPILFIAVASELRFPPPSNHISQGSITTQEIDIATARRFVTGRLQEFCHSLPAKPIRQALRLVEETWARLDRGSEVGQGCFWMDVMEQIGGETIFG
ncbi:fungal-specific transcription factor domain-containing protein [Halenospora varia]|nr:fungal-specific transcription factor domain-containing protein [Halenospora varia]